MKIMLASFLYESEIGGGAAVVVNQLAQSLIRKNHTVVVLTTWPGHFVKTEVIDLIKVIRLPASNIYWVADKDQQPVYKKVFWQLFDIWNPFIYRLALEVFRSESPDIVHSHKLRGLSPSIWSAASVAGVKKIVHTCHDFELLSPEGLFMGKAGRLAREQNLVMRPYQLVRKYFSRLVHTVTAPSRLVMDLHKEMRFFPRANARIVYNTHGFDSSQIQQNKLMSSRSCKIDVARRFLYLGRLDKAKGIDLLCQAFSRVADQKPDFLLRITGWGSLDEALREKYKHQDNIVFTGPAFGDQKVKLFRDSDMLIAPSVAPENFPIVIAEAYSHGVPVITSRAGALPEIVRDGETGFLFTTGSEDELFSVLTKVSEERFLLNSISKNCFEEAKKFTTEKFLGDYLDIYVDNAR
jgi:glycosyltransferase involved in cell wall biosynthesis